MRKGISIRSLILSIILFLIIPLTIIAGINTFIQLNKAEESIFTTETNRLRLIVNQLEQELTGVESSITDLMLNNVALQRLADGENETKTYLDTYEISQIFNSYLVNNENLTMMMLYCEKTGLFFQQDSGQFFLAYTERSALRSNLKAYFIEASGTKEYDAFDWYVLQIGGRNLYCRTIQANGIHIIGIFDLGQIIRRAELNGIQQQKLYFRKNDIFLTTLPPEYTVDNWKDTQGVEVIGKMEKYLAVSEEILNLTLTSISPYAGAFSSLNESLYILMFTTFLSVAFLPVFIYLIRKNLFLPMASLKKTMDTIRAGDLTARASKLPQHHEFKQVNDTFNDMISRIETLKIEKYENELESKRIQLQYYQVQIRPHFYLNCLKNLYAMAQSKEFKNIEKSILMLSNYLRYTFVGNDTTVPLLEELQQCDNYIQMIGVSAVFPPKLLLDIDSRSTSFHVPPLSVLTFVENCLRHCMSTQDTLIITILSEVSEHESGDRIHITIRDNGPGFPQPILELLNNAQWKQQKGHIGLKNVIQRCQIIYGDSFGIHFANDFGGVVKLDFVMPPDQRQRRLT